MDYKTRVEKEMEELRTLRRNFHKEPELGYEEHKTSKAIQTYLQNLGLETQVVTKTGVVATLEGAHSGPCILLRADMDALPQTEKTGLDFASTTPGVMHACGHDGHMAVLLVTAKILCEMRDELHGSVKFVFQPNEEEAGALAMIEAGVLEDPKADMAFAQHIWSQIPVGVMGVASGAVMAATEHFEIEVKGKAGHTSAPHECIDPICAACQIVLSVQQVQTRQMNPLDAAVILFGEIHGGTVSNSVPGKVKLSGTIRYIFRDEPLYKERLYTGFEAVIEGVCKAHNVEYELQYIPSNPTMFNDDRAVKLVKKAAESCVGTDKITEYYCMGGEDFAEFSHRVPSCFFFVGCGNAEKKTDFPHHHECFDIDEDSLPLGVEMFLRVVGECLLK